MYENLSNIKYGDILVAEYPDINAETHQRNYIIFIANGIISDGGGNQFYKFVNIGVIAAINLGGGFFVNNEREKSMSIGFTSWSKDANETSIIRKPKFFEMAELITVMKANNFKFNRKTKNIEKL
jgi:hypothetical protein